MKKYGFNFEISYKKLSEYLYSEGKPDKAPNPKNVLFNTNLAQFLQLDFSKASSELMANIFTGNTLIDKDTCLSQAYAGHQFGYFNILGDGRVHLLGEHVIGEVGRFDIQLKGSGRTVYSRGGDGKAALGPMLREYLISEAMHHLGIPTSRSLAVTLTGEAVYRDKELPGAILTRVLSSGIRVGTFELAAINKNKKLISDLIDYTIQRHYPSLKTDNNNALSLLKVVGKSQANLITNWMRVGFVHGVMNTDNMAISGETIDYGPCAFIDAYSPDAVFSSIDHNSRYGFANQAKIAQWNLCVFAETLLPHIHESQNKAIELAKEEIDRFSDMFNLKWHNMMKGKLGLIDDRSEDADIFNELLSWMHKNNADYTNTFRDLAQLNSEGELEILKDEVYQSDSFRDWHRRWGERVKSSGVNYSDAFKLMNRNNPSVIPRNHRVEQVLDAAYESNFQPVNELLEVLKDPYSNNKQFAGYKDPPNIGERVYQTFCGT